jgi:D-alanyl-lipoteichoic acid acyltransferase DltB (MBOAT superfamily)
VVFSSYAFIFAFLPIGFAGYWLAARFLGNTAAKAWLVIASLGFYAQGSSIYLPLLVLTTVFNYGAVRLIARQRRGSVVARLLLSAAIVESLAFLLYFKYANFLIDNVNALLGASLPHRNALLPLGISFYTFIIISCVVDTYRGRTEPRSFLDFCTFVTFFPHLIVGPISRHGDVVPQLPREDLPVKLDARSIALGIVLFSFGCAQKILIADPLITHARQFYGLAGGGSFFEAWGGVLSYTFAYYFDFSGYIDMALGLALFFNIKLPYNFDSPYKARDFADFWRRWNITVSEFFYEHIFRNIFHFGDRVGKMVLAIMATFLVSGLWHGVGWHFVLWGAVNGVFVCAANIMTLKQKKLSGYLAWALTFFLMVLTRVLFDSNSVTQAVAVYKTILDVRPLFVHPSAFLAQGLTYLRGNAPVAFLLLVGAGLSFLAPSTKEISEKFELKWYYAVLAGAALVASVFYMGTVSNFLYMQF